jgi:hypothetical protein
MKLTTDIIKNKNVLGLIVLILLSALVFYLELSSTPTSITYREEIFKKIIEFSLSIGIGWFIQKIISEEESQKSLKKFALSAYRRIIDIQSTLSRLINTIQAIRNRYPEDKQNELDTIMGMALGIKDTVSSSSADWIDILGEDLKKKGRIEQLEIEEMKLNVLSVEKENKEEIKLRIKELREEIDNIRSDLPTMLQANLNSSNEKWGPFPPKFSETTHAYFMTSINNFSAIFINVNGYGKQDIPISGLSKKPPLFIRANFGMHQIGLTVNIPNQFGGFITNPEGIEVDPTDFAATLLGILTKVFKPINFEGEFSIEISDYEFYGSSRNKQTQIIKILVPHDFILKND